MKRNNKLKQYYKNKKVLITGGAGSIGSEIAKTILTYKPGVIRILDNNEAGLFDIKHYLNSQKVRLLYGDIRDKNRIKIALENIDIVFHAAAMKHVGLCEMNPFEAIKTNVLGAQNLIESTIELGVKKVLGISTDKAVDPINVMGATKLLAERLFLSAKHYKGGKDTLFSCVRFGNVLVSQGSVIPLFIKQIKDGGPVTITDPDMTRFAMRITDAVDLILKAGYLTSSQEIFILKMPVIKIADLAELLIRGLAPRYGYSPEKIKIKIIGNEFREKTHEELFTYDELPHIKETKDMFIVDFDKVDSYKKSKLLMKKFKKLKKSSKVLTRKELQQLLIDNKIL